MGRLNLLPWAGSQSLAQYMFPSMLGVIQPASSSGVHPRERDLSQHRRNTCFPGFAEGLCGGAHQLIPEIFSRVTLTLRSLPVITN